MGCGASVPAAEEEKKEPTANPQADGAGAVRAVDTTGSKNAAKDRNESTVQNAATRDMHFESKSATVTDTSGSKASRTGVCYILRLGWMPLLTRTIARCEWGTLENVTYIHHMGILDIKELC